MSKSKAMSKKSRRYRKKSLRKSRKYKGGECPCNKFNGGYGPASFPSFDVLHKAIMPNPHQNDPTDPSSIISSRATSYRGGRNNKHVRFSRKNRIIRGGNNGFSTFGSWSGASEFNNMTSLNSVNPAPNVQPTMHMFGSHNPPLV